METCAAVSFGLYDTTAKADGMPVTQQPLQPFASLLALAGEYPVALPKVATLEENYFLLDGSHNLFPDHPGVDQWGAWWQELSDARGSFQHPPELVVEFSVPHSSAGLTLHFDPHTEDSPSLLTIRWYDHLGNLLSTGEYAGSGSVWALQNKVEAYQRLRITFAGTSKPRRYCKLCGIDYGIEKNWEGEALVGASLTEELDPISASMPVNTLVWSLHSQSDEYDIINPSGIYSLLQQGQKVELIGWQDYQKLELGTFYLESWENRGGLLHLTARDAVSLMEKQSFLGGIYEGVSAKALLKQIFAVAGADYRIEETLPDQTISGWLPVCTCREALRRVAFAMGAVADCSRGKEVRVTQPDNRPTVLFPESTKLEGQEIRTRSAVAKVELICYRYSPDTQRRQLYQGTLSAGAHRMIWPQPVYGLVITGGQIVESGDNFADIRVESTGTVLISGYGYTIGKQCVTAQTDLDPGKTGKTMSITEASVLPQDAMTVAHRAADYCGLPYESTMTLLPGTWQVGQIAVAKGKGGRQLKGMIEMMETNLTGGFLSRIRLVGSAIETISGYYSGELKAGEEMGVL